MFVSKEGEHESVSVDHSDEQPFVSRHPASLGKEHTSTLASSKTKQKFLPQVSGGDVSISVDVIPRRAFSQSYQRRLEQNRQSARRSRNKKKEILNYMEGRVQQLQEELQATQRELKESRDRIDRYLSQHNLTNSINVGRKITYERLEHLIAEDSPDEDEINLLMDSLKWRIGANGVERQGTINYYFKQMINIYFPALHRYMMWTADESIELFGLRNPDCSWLEGLRTEASGLSTEQIEQIGALKPVLCTLQHALCGFIWDLQDSKQLLDVESEKLERILEDCRKGLTSVQSAQLVLFMQRNKYRRQMDLWRQERINLQAKQLEDKPTKRTKLE